MWIAAGVGLLAVIVANHDSSEQWVVMNGQLDIMKEAGRAWVGPTGAYLTDKSSADQPLKVTLNYGNWGRAPAIDVAYYSSAAFPTIDGQSDADNNSSLPFWTDAERFNTALVCQKASESNNRLTVFPSAITYSTNVGMTKESAPTINGVQASANQIVTLIANKRILYVVYGCFCL